MHIDIQGAPDQIRRRRSSYGEQSTYNTVALNILNF